MLALDSSVLLAILKSESSAEAWIQRLRAFARNDDLVACEVVLAELAPLYRSAPDLIESLDRLAVGFDAIEPETTYAAGRIFADYRRRGGPRSAMIPDFLIAAHAQYQTAGLIAADRGYLRSYFSELPVLGLEASE